MSKKEESGHIKPCDTQKVMTSGKTLASAPDSMVYSKEDTNSPVDSSYSWFVVVLVGISFLIGAGFFRSFTLVYQKLLIRFNQGATLTAWVSAMYGCVKLCSSPIVSALVTKFGTQKVGMTGGILCMVGMVSSAFAPRLFYLYFTIGVIVGFGSNLTHQSGFIMLGQYFKKKKNIANGIATMFVGFGCFVWAPLMHVLLEKYGCPGTFLIFGALVLNYLPIGLLFRPLPEKYLSDHDNREPKDIKQTWSGINSTNTLHLQLHETSAEVETNITTEITQGSDKNCTKHRKCISCEGCIPLNTCYKYFGVNLLKSVDFVMLLMLMFGFFISQGMLDFSSGLCQEIGELRHSEVAIIVAISAGSDIISRPVFGAFFDASCMKKVSLVTFPGLAFLAGCTQCLIPLTTSFSGMLTLFLFNQIFSSAFHTQHFGIITDLMGIKNLPAALGLLRFVCGLGIIVGPTVGGLLTDTFGSYTYAFFLGGGMFSLLSLVFGCYIICCRYK